MSTSNMRAKPAGFTLIEMMITVAIIGILAAIAYPSYQESVRKGRRADAQAALTGLAAVMERDFLRGSAYRDVIAANLYPGRVPLELAPPYPNPDPRQTYRLTISFPLETPYLLTATPTGSQADDRCGAITLAASGRQGPSTPDDCWRR